jgi:hypothetical protein
MRFVVPAVTPIAVTAERVTGRNLDQDDPEAVGVLDLHLDRAQGSAAGSVTTRTSVAASRACSA